MPEIYDLIIIGAGPSGCSAAIYTARGGLDTILLDKNPSAGALAWAQKISNYPGQSQETSGRELLETMRRQALSFGAAYKQTQVIASDLKKSPKEVVTTDGTYLGKAVLVASGARGRKEKIKGEEEFTGKGVSYCATCDGPLFQDATVAVVGEDEEAVADILILERMAKKVYIITSGKELKTDKETQVIIKNNPKVELKSNFYLKEIKGSNLVNSIVVADSKGQQENIGVEGVFVHLPGNDPIVDFLGGCLDLGERSCILVNKNQETCLEGVFAAGDVTCQHMKQAVVAAAEGAIAAVAIDKYINKRNSFRYSR